MEEVAWGVIALAWVLTSVMYLRDMGRVNDRIDRQAVLDAALSVRMGELHMNQAHLIAALTAKGNLSPEVANKLMTSLEISQGLYHEEVKRVSDQHL